MNTMKEGIHSMKINEIRSFEERRWSKIAPLKEG
jgi:hypothetical protein